MISCSGTKSTKCDRIHRTNSTRISQPPPFRRGLNNNNYDSISIFITSELLKYVEVHEPQCEVTMQNIHRTVHRVTNIRKATDSCKLFYLNITMAII